MAGTKSLSFRDVDELGFAACGLVRPGGAAPYSFVPRTLGPLLELLHIEAMRGLPRHPEGKDWLVRNGADHLISALQRGDETWCSSDHRRIGFIRTRRLRRNFDNVLSFLMHATTAAREISGFRGTVPNQLAAAMQELEDNIHEHSEAPETGLLAYRATQGVFEFTASDHGIGILNSLKQCPEFAALQDSGSALEAAISEGTSRFGSNGLRGHGFRPIFVGLTNMHGALRFRSGDHALVMDGTGPALAMAQVQQKPFLHGFFASVRCSIEPV